MRLSEIQKAVFARLKTVDTLLPIAYPREDGFEAAGKPYARVFIRPFEIQEPVYCDGVMRSGFIQLNVVYPDNSGVVVPTEEAEKFTDLFPEGLVFDGIVIPNPTDPMGQVADDQHEGWFITPTLIYFEARP